MTVPLWAALLMGIGSPALTFLGVLLGQRLQRRNAEELEVRSRREEAMRIMRWAAEQAGSRSPLTAFVGVVTLESLASSTLLVDEEKRMIDAVLGAVLSKRDEQLQEIQAEGDVSVVVERSSLSPGSTLGAAEKENNGD